MKAVILAAGEGKRLRPFTFTRPKHMIEISGKPLMEYLLISLREAGIKDILMVVHYKYEQIKKYFGDGSSLDIKIKYIYQKDIKGTANALSLAEKYLTDDFIAVYGDLLITSRVVESVLNFHKSTKASVILTTLPVPNYENYGVIKTEGNKVINIIEKPSKKAKKKNYINAGFYVFSTDIFQAIRLTETSPRGEQEITDSIRILIEDKHDVLAVKIFSEDWLDIGKPWDLLDINSRVLSSVKSEIQGKIEKGVHLGESVFIGNQARIRSGTYIEGPAYIGKGSDIGPNCYIRPIIMNHVHIGHLSYIGDSIIGEGSNLGAGTITANLRFDRKSVKMKINNMIVDTNKKKLGVFMGDKIRTGVGTLFMPGVKVGPNSWIFPNIVITKDIPQDTFLVLKQQIEKLPGSHRER
jgi:bifunctional UDP-N-acetylglucosamine pyrophosphorylase/glucosamine-1-phosphate N-acetyltransferase